MKKIYYNWEETGLLIKELIEKVKSSNINFDGVYGIPKGGLPIAVSLSYALDIPLLLSPTEKTLIVDDISDTGKTLEIFKKKKIACLFLTKWTTMIPDFWIKEKLNKNEWIVFPWDENVD
ncbi:hypothetical protein KAI04_04000 [Candidatus Pacearchaeota archaeon]|nr:hypothetical protein [Candidatus Pacearchaeota archaeon]